MKNLEFWDSLFLEDFGEFELNLWLNKKIYQN